METQNTFLNDYNNLLVEFAQNFKVIESNFDSIYQEFQNRPIHEKLIGYSKMAITISLYNEAGQYNEHLLRMGLTEKTIKKLKTINEIRKDSAKLNLGKYVFEDYHIFIYYTDYTLMYLLNKILIGLSKIDDEAKKIVTDWDLEIKKLKRRIINKIDINTIDKKDRLFTYLFNIKRIEFLDEQTKHKTNILPKDFLFYYGKYFSNPILLSYIPYLKANMEYNKNIYGHEIKRSVYLKQAFNFLKLFSFNGYYDEEGVNELIDKTKKSYYLTSHNIYISKVMNNYFR